MTAALEGSEGLAARPGRFTPGKDPVPILQEAGWAPGPVYTGGKSRPHRDSIPDRPARSSVTIPTELPGPHFDNNDVHKLHINATIYRADRIQLETLIINYHKVIARRCLYS